MRASWRSALALSLVALLADASSVRAQSLGVVPLPPAPGMDGLDHDLASVTADVERLEHESQRLVAEEQGLAPRRDALSRRARDEIRLLYHLLQGEPLALQAGPEALLDHMARLEHVRRSLRATLNEIATVNERARTIGVDRARNTAAMSDAQTRRSSLETQRRQLEVLDGMRLRVTPAGLGAPPDAPSPSVTVYGGAPGATSPDAASFGDAAGHLLFPLAGRTEVRRAQREGAEGPGLEILASLGAPVRAVYDGRVAFADRYGTYGRIVILDHGDHYYTVSANLGSMTVHVGDEVTAGSVIGTVGDDGRGPMLYFEVRHGADTIDPGPWLGI